MTGPVIVAGARGSGTGALAGALGRLLDRPVTEAGAALPLLGAWHAAAARHAAGLAAAGLPPEPAPPPPLPWGEDALLRLSDPLPEAPGLHALPALLARWPALRVVGLRSPGIAFVSRRRARWPERPFAEHCAAWAAAEAAFAALARDFAPRLLLDPAEPAALAAFLGLPEAPPLPPAEPPSTLARSGWTLPEIELFAGICGDAMRAAGQPLDLAEAARARPLDLLAPLRAGQGRAGGGLALRWPPLGQGLRLRLAAGPGRLVLPGLWPGGRDRLSLFLTAATRPLELEVLVSGSLSRRPLLAQALRLEPGEEAEVAARLPAADELLDLTLSAAPEEPTTCELRQARLFRL